MRNGPKDVKLPKIRWSSKAKRNKYADIVSSKQQGTAGQRRAAKQKREV